MGVVRETRGGLPNPMNDVETSSIATGVWHKLWKKILGSYMAHAQYSLLSQHEQSEGGVSPVPPTVPALMTEC